MSDRREQDSGGKNAPQGHNRVMATTERVQAPRGPGPMMGVPSVGKAEAFGPSARRLMGRLAPHWVAVTAVIVAGIISVGLSALGPRVLGRATDILFGGVIGAQMPASISREAAIAAARAGVTSRSRLSYPASTSCPAKASTSRPWGGCC